MIYSYNKSQQDALILRFILVKKKLYMFRTDLLSIIGSLDTVFTTTGMYYTSYVDCLLARSLADSHTSIIVGKHNSHFISVTPT